MNKLTIQKSKFDDEKNKIKAFAKNLPSEIALPRVDTDGALWGLFDHRVTGAELNRLSKQIQNNLIASNQTVSTIIKEFTQIYNTFEALDKNYIQAIVGSVEEASKAGIQALEASDQAGEAIAQANRASYEAVIASSKAQNSSAQAKKSSEQALNASELASKASGDALEASRDAALASSQALKASSEANQASEEALKANQRLERLYKIQAGMIEKLNQFKKRFDSLEYVQDLEKTWEDIQKIKKLISSFQVELNENKNLSKRSFDYQDQKITRQKEEVLAQLDFLSTQLNEKFNDINQLQIKNNLSLTKRTEDLEREIEQKTESINKALKEKDGNSLKQKKEILLVVENHNLSIKTRIDGVDKGLSTQEDLIKGLSISLSDFKKKIANELQIIKEQLLDQLESLTSSLNEKINLLQCELLVKEKLFNELLNNHQLEFERVSLDLTNEVKEVQAVISVKEQFTNEQLSVLNHELCNQRENFLKKAQYFTSIINQSRQSIYEKDLYLHQQTKIKNKQLSKRILYAYLFAGFFGAVSVTHLVLNILEIL